LHEVALYLKRGRRYALVGGSGSGKSTLLRVLAGLEMAQTITLNAALEPAQNDPATVGRWLRASATLIPQETELFEATLAENLLLAEPLPGLEPTLQPGQALHCAAADFVYAKGLDLQQAVAERGGNWSGGQRQRVALARGVLAAQGSPLVLLDEPTAALDPETERRVMQQLTTIFADACLIVSVHRLHLLDGFDEVLFMENGWLLDAGPVGEVAARCAPFRAALAAQAGA
jgi:ABC-type bacteriocin/lantibiotic exporter with double-glycine peptidase domain